MLQEKEELRRRVGELDRSLAETRNTSKAEIRNLTDEKVDFRRKVDRLESRVSSLRYGILSCFYLHGILLKSDLGMEVLLSSLAKGHKGNNVVFYS